MTLAATIPNAMMYNAGWFSYTCDSLFWKMMKAGTTTSENGITGDKMLVPCGVAGVGDVTYISVRERGKIC